MPRRPPRVEIPVFSAESAIKAASLGAARIELNAPGSYPAGGLTPPLADLARITSVLTVPVRVMIRPRGPPPTGPDFVYSDAEFEQMLAEIATFKESGHLSAARGDGFVFGVLEEAVPGKRLMIDMERNQLLVSAARPLGCTFHRAFDAAIAHLYADIMPHAMAIRRCVEDLAACGFDGVLTSGGPGSVLDNRSRLNVAAERARAGFQVLVGGGVRSVNVGEVLRRLDWLLPRNRLWVHSSCLTGGGEEVDEEEVRELVTRVNAAAAREVPGPTRDEQEGSRVEEPSNLANCGETADREGRERLARVDTLTTYGIAGQAKTEENNLGGEPPNAQHLDSAR